MSQVFSMHFSLFVSVICRLYHFSYILQALSGIFFTLYIANCRTNEQINKLFVNAAVFSYNII